MLSRLSFSVLIVLVFVVGACNKTVKITDGPTAIDRKQYAVAVPLLQKEFNKAKGRVAQGKVAFQLAEALRLSGKAVQSIDWYSKAYDYNYGPEALKKQAYALKAAERYDEAQAAFKELGIEIGSPYEYRKEISGMDIIKGWQKNPVPGVSAEKATFNSTNNDYGVALIADEPNALVFTSDRQAASGKDTYGWTGNAFSDLFFKSKEEGISSFSEVLNSPANEGTPTFHPSGKYLVFTRCQGTEDRYCQLLISKKKGLEWTAPSVLPFVTEGINYGQPAFSSSGQSLLFAADHPEGWGGFDLYEVAFSTGDWQEPQLLSRSVNTDQDEQFPFLDNDTLYFASNGHTNMGGLDIFRTVRLANGAWMPVQNMRAPINSGGDDFGFVVDRRQEYPEGRIMQGFFASNREGSKADDIYTFAMDYVEPPVEIPTEDTIIYALNLDVYVLEKIFSDARNPNSPVLGKKLLEGASVEILPSGDQPTSAISKGEGGIRVSLTENSEYRFVAKKDGFLTTEGYFSTKGIAQDPKNPVQNFELELVLDKIFFNQEITLENIYYDFDEAEIRRDAMPTLNVLAGILQLNTNLQIELGSHTDCRGNDRYNEELSQRRAQSAVNYLVEKGIDANRLFAKGYGESKPSAECLCSRCTEEEHQQNRRTTFRVLQ